MFISPKEEGTLVERSEERKRMSKGMTLGMRKRIRDTCGESLAGIFYKTNQT